MFVQIDIRIKNRNRRREIMIDSINSINFKGLIYIKKDNAAINTQYIAELAQSEQDKNTTDIQFTNTGGTGGSGISSFSVPLDTILTAYKTAAKNPETVVEI